MVALEAKEHYFWATIVSTQFRAPELFWVVRFLLGSDQQDEVDWYIAHHTHFTKNFPNKISDISSDVEVINSNSIGWFQIAD